MVRRGFTLVETMSVIAIVAVLASIAYPVIGQVRRRSSESAAEHNLRQLHLAFSLYRSEYDGDGRYGGASLMGLPDMTTVYGGHPQAIVKGSDGLWSSPCGQHPDTTLAVVSGTNLDYHATDVADETWMSYVLRKEEAAILLYDQNCSPLSAVLHSPYMEKQIIGVRLNGSLVRKQGRETFIDLASFDP